MAFAINNYDTPQIMGILNVTPDSFSDGGRHNTLEHAMRAAEKMLSHGALIIDVGGESTRPGAPKVDLETELQRVIPVIEALKKEFNCVVSIDTSKPEVMQAGLDKGVDIINDVFALGKPGAMEVLAQYDVPVCLMHMQGTPETMQLNPTYEDVVADIKQFFQFKIDQCEAAGIKKERLWLDPGFGFGKTLANNYQILAKLADFKSFELPVLAGISRKSMIGNLLNLATDDRMLGSVVAATLALNNGAKVLRVHDVAETNQALTIFNAMKYGVGNE